MGIFPGNFDIEPGGLGAAGIQDALLLSVAAYITAFALFEEEFIQRVEKITNQTFHLEGMIGSLFDAALQGSKFAGWNGSMRNCQNPA